MDCLAGKAARHPVFVDSGDRGRPGFRVTKTGSSFRPTAVSDHLTFLRGHPVRRQPDSQVQGFPGVANSCSPAADHRRTGYLVHHLSCYPLAAGFYLEAVSSVRCDYCRHRPHRGRSHVTYRAPHGECCEHTALGGHRDRSDWRPAWCAGLSIHHLGSR